MHGLLFLTSPKFPKIIVNIWEKCLLHYCWRTLHCTQLLLFLFSATFGIGEYSYLKTEFSLWKQPKFVLNSFDHSIHPVCLKNTDFKILFISPNLKYFFHKKLKHVFLSNVFLYQVLPFILYLYLHDFMDTILTLSPQASLLMWPSYLLYHLWLQTMIMTLEENEQ